MMNDSNWFGAWALNFTVWEQVPINGHLPTWNETDPWLMEAYDTADYNLATNNDIHMVN